MRFRILSYNIHKCIGGIDRKYAPSRIIDAIRYYQPDVALLQEVDDGVPRSRNDRQVDLIGDALGYKYRAFQGNVYLRKGCYGNAILSQHPLTNKTNIDLTVPLKKRRSGLVAQVHIPCRERTKIITLINVHLGLAAYERAQQVHRLTDSIYFSQDQQSSTILLGGDFNDLWENLCRKVLNSKGYTSALNGSKTYPAVFPSRALDRIFHKGEIELHNAFVGHTKITRSASDHLPVIADFKL